MKTSNKENRIQIKLDDELFTRLTKFCSLERRTKTSAIEIALIRYFNEYDIHKNSGERTVD